MTWQHSVETSRKLCKRTFNRAHIWQSFLLCIWDGVCFFSSSVLEHLTMKPPDSQVNSVTTSQLYQTWNTFAISILKSFFFWQAASNFSTLKNKQGVEQLNKQCGHPGPTSRGLIPGLDTTRICIFNSPRGSGATHLDTLWEGGNNCLRNSKWMEKLTEKPSSLGNQPQNLRG